MKPSSNLASRSALALLAVVCALAVTSCKKKSPPPATPDNGAAPTAQKSATASVEKTSFAEVTSQLDSGGMVYGYLSTSQWTDDLSGRIGGWRDLFTGMPGMGEDERTKVTQVFDLIGRVVKGSGIEGISGVGLSGVAIEKGLYQTKFVVQRNPASPNVGIWKLFGEASRPLDELNWLPAETAWAAFGDFDAAATWKGITQIVNQSGIAEAKGGIAQLEAGVQQGTGSSLDQLLGSLGGQFGVFLTLNEARMVSLPLPGGAPLQIPDPGIVIVAKVKDDTLFNLIERALQENPQVIRSDADGVRMRTMPVPLPLPLNLRPTIAREGDLLWFASSDELLKNVLAVKAGKTPGIKSTDEFKRLSKGMAMDGNSFAFASDRLGKLVAQVMTVAIGHAAQGPGAPPAALMQKLAGLNQPVSSFGVGSRTPQGWISVTRGTQNPAQAVILPLVVAPTAIMAGMTLPALAKAKSKAQTIQCVNNLKQIGLAARIYATDHNDKYPPDIISMKNELSSPRVLVCPSDPNKINPATISWDNFDMSRSSYEYFPGLSEATPEKVMVRCRIDGNECFADGSVRQKR